MNVGLGSLDFAKLRMKVHACILSPLEPPDDGRTLGV